LAGKIGFEPWQTLTNNSISFNIYAYWLLSSISHNWLNTRFISTKVWSQTVVAHISAKYVLMLWLDIVKPNYRMSRRSGWWLGFDINHILNDSSFLPWLLLSYLEETGKLSKGIANQLQILSIHRSISRASTEFRSIIPSTRTFKHK